MGSHVRCLLVGIRLLVVIHSRHDKVQTVAARQDEVGVAKSEVAVTGMNEFFVIGEKGVVGTDLLGVCLRGWAYVVVVEAGYVLCRRCRERSGDSL